MPQRIWHSIVRLSVNAATLLLHPPSPWDARPNTTHAESPLFCCRHHVSDFRHISADAPTQPKGKGADVHIGYFKSEMEAALAYDE